MRSGSTGSRAEGLTLLEVLIAASLLLLLLSLFLSVLVPGLRSFSRGSTRAELQQMAAVATRRLLEDLQNSAPGALGLVDSHGPQEPAGVGLVRVQGISEAGQPIWEDQAIVYYWLPTQRDLVRKVWPPAPPEPAVPFDPRRPPTLFPSLLREIMQQVNGTETLVATEVTRFQIRQAGAGPGIAQPLTLDLVLERQDAAGGERFQWTREVYLRNSR